MIEPSFVSEILISPDRLQGRIAEAVQGLEIFEMDLLPEFLSRAAVIAAIKGETT